MEELKIIDLYKNNDSNNEQFKDNVRSSLKVNTVFESVEDSYEWLDLMEDTIRYLDNILRNPNRLIINEDEIVKVELARRITVDSIKHLAKHTNYIQDINEKDEVRPSKILNINKDETYVTYENRLIYTLINRMLTFIEIKKKSIMIPYQKDNKKIEYQAKSQIGKEKINMNFILDSKIDTKAGEVDTNESLQTRVEKLEADISMLTNTEVYRDLKRKNLSLLIPPIKKTNLILKNSNFQKIMILWDFLQENAATPPKKNSNKQNYEDNGILKQYINDTFLLNYIALSTLSKEKVSSQEHQSAVEEITNNLIERIVELNANLPEEQLKDIVGKKILIARHKNKASLSEIQNIYSRQIKLFLNKIENFRFEGA